MNENLDSRKLNLIKIKVIEIERRNIIKKESKEAMIEEIRKYIEKVVDGKC